MIPHSPAGRGQEVIPHSPAGSGEEVVAVAGRGLKIPAADSESSGSPSGSPSRSPAREWEVWKGQCSHSSL